MYVFIMLLYSPRGRNLIKQIKGLGFLPSLFPRLSNSEATSERERDTLERSRRGGRDSQSQSLLTQPKKNLHKPKSTPETKKKKRGILSLPPSLFLSLVFLSCLRRERPCPRARRRRRARAWRCRRARRRSRSSRAPATPAPARSRSPRRSSPPLTPTAAEAEAPPPPPRPGPRPSRSSSLAPSRRLRSSSMRRRGDEAAAGSPGPARRSRWRRRRRRPLARPSSLCPPASAPPVCSTPLGCFSRPPWYVVTPAATSCWKKILPLFFCFIHQAPKKQMFLDLACELIKF